MLSEVKSESASVLMDLQNYMNTLTGNDFGREMQKMNIFGATIDDAITNMGRLRSPMNTLGGDSDNIIPNMGRNKQITMSMAEMNMLAVDFAEIFANLGRHHVPLKMSDLDFLDDMLADIIMQLDYQLSTTNGRIVGNFNVSI